MSRRNSAMHRSDLPTPRAVRPVLGWITVELALVSLAAPWIVILGLVALSRLIFTLLASSPAAATAAIALSGAILLVVALAYGRWRRAGLSLARVVAGWATGCVLQIALMWGLHAAGVIRPSPGAIVWVVVGPVLSAIALIVISTGSWLRRGEQPA